MRRSLGPTLSQAALLGGALALAACNKAPPRPPSGAPAPEAPPKAPEAPKAEAPAPAKAPEAPAKAPPAPRDEATGLGVVLASKLNVRTEPHVDKKNIHGALHCGDIVALGGAAGDRNEWYKVKVAKIEGYAHGAFIVPLRPGARRPLCEIARGDKFKEKDADPMGKDPVIDITLPELNRVITKKDQQRLAPAPEPEAFAGVDTKGGAAGQPAPSPAKPPVPAAAGAATAQAPAQPGKPDQPSRPAEVAQAPPKTPAPPPPASRPVEKDPPDKIVLSLQPPSQKAQVTFPHDVHMNQIACFKCHHPVSRDAGGLKRLSGDGDPNDEKLCHNCHKREGTPGITKIAARKAFHSNCIDCHRTSGDPKAPFQCSGCHKPN